MIKTNELYLITFIIYIFKLVEEKHVSVISKVWKVITTSY